MSPDCSLRELEDDDRSRGGIQEWRDEGVQRDIDPDGDGDDGDILAIFAARKKKVNSEESYVDFSVESPESVLKDYFSMKLEDLNLKFWSKYQDKKKERYSRALFRLCCCK